MEFLVRENIGVLYLPQMVKSKKFKFTFGMKHPKLDLKDKLNTKLIVPQ